MVTHAYMEMTCYIELTLTTNLIHCLLLIVLLTSLALVSKHGQGSMESKDESELQGTRPMIGIRITEHSQRLTFSIYI